MLIFLEYLETVRIGEDFTDERRERRKDERGENDARMGREKFRGNGIGSE